MNLIYLHGFQSNPKSLKGQLLKRYIEQYTEHKIYLPDLNMPPIQALEKVEHQIKKLENVCLVGSSLGGFYATQFAHRYAIPTVVINPVIQPWVLFHRLFGHEHMPYRVTEQWTLDTTQLEDLEKLAVPFVQDASKLLVLLQQGDEVLDYREAQRYYSKAIHQSLLITEANGNHAMDDFMEKIPMILQFLSDGIQ